MRFEELNLKPEILSGIAKLGYTEPTKIQEEVILEFVKGHNVIGQSQTGTGKTAAFLISLLQAIDTSRMNTQALIIAPTRELVTQICEEIKQLSVDMRIRSVAVYGGSPMGRQIEMLRRGQTIVVGTPGRVIDMIERRVLRTDEIDFFVLDEVDRMLDMGFIEDIDFIWGSLPKVRQTLAFSATITPVMRSTVEKYLGVDYTFIRSTNTLTVDKIDHSFVEVPHIDKYDTLKRFIISHESKKTIVFVQMKRDTEELANRLVADGLSATYLNGDMRQRERFRALKDFQEGKVDIFVVTDVAARGINVKNIDLVVNFDVPSDPESYIHRIGRTGRAGAEGKAIMFVSRGENIAFRNIERHNRIRIKQVDHEGIEMVRAEEDSRGSRGGSRNGGGRYGNRSSSSRGGGYGRDNGGSRGGYGQRDSGSRSGYRDDFVSRTPSSVSAPKATHFFEDLEGDIMPSSWSNRPNAPHSDTSRDGGYRGNDRPSHFSSRGDRNGGGDRGGYQGRGGHGGGYRGNRDSSSRDRGDRY